MSMSKVDWKSNAQLAVGKGATVQEFMAIVGADKLAIDVAPWGEGRLRDNGQEIAHLKNAKGRVRLFANSKRSLALSAGQGCPIREGRKFCEITSRQSQAS
jgi:enoyl-[acyl-carrier protein] reductase I